MHFLPVLLFAALGAGITYAVMSSQEGGEFIDLNSPEAIRAYAKEQALAEEPPDRMVIFLYDSQWRDVWEVFRDAELPATVVALDVHAMLAAEDALPGLPINPEQRARIESDGLDELPVIAWANLEDSVFAGNYAIEQIGSQPLELLEEKLPLQDEKGRTVFVRIGQGGLPEVLADVRSLLDSKPKAGARGRRPVRSMRHRPSLTDAMRLLARTRR